MTEFISKEEIKFKEELDKEMVLRQEVENYYNSYEIKKKIPDLLGKTIRVSKNQYSEIHDISEKIFNTLSMKEVDIFIYEDFYYGVESRGLNKKWIEISSKTIEDFSDLELTFLIAKELYNIRVGNTAYESLIDQYLNNYNLINIPGLSIKKESFKLIAYKWMRAACFSSDNFALDYCGSLNSSIHAIMLTILNSRELVNRVNINEYIKQCDEIHLLNDEVYDYTKLDEMLPYGGFRIKNLISRYSNG